MHRLYNNPMEQMKVMRGSGRYRYLQKRKKRRRMTILALIVAAVVVIVWVAVANSSGSKDEKIEESTEAIPTRYADVDSEQLVNDETVRLELSIGEVYMLALPEKVDVRNVTFTSENPGIVRVDSAGRLDALQKGTAKITASSIGFNATCECTVSAAPAISKTQDAPITTAITANADILAKNAQNGEDDLYSIVVNRRTNVVTVYTYDARGDYNVPVRAMVCSCGTGGEDTTPTGSYSIYLREEWLFLSGDVYGLYVSGIWGDYLFHSVPYRTMDHDALKIDEFNKLGTNASQGCVRMMIADVLWIYENCPIYTPVEIVDADASVDVLGKPATVRISDNISWDPTDPDDANPYKGRTPAFSGAADVTLKKGDAFDPMSGVTAQDICGNDITDRVEITGRVIGNKAGVYYLTYSVTDDFNLTSEITRVVIVEA